MPPRTGRRRAVLNGNQFSGIEPVLVLGRGAAGHAEAVVGEDLAGTGDMAEDAVEDLAAALVGVHPEFEEMAQKPPALRHAERRARA